MPSRYRVGPYAARYRNKRKFRGLWKRKGTAVANRYLRPTYNRIVKTVDKLKNVVNAEMKQYDGESSSAAGGAQVIHLNPIDQGDGHSNRDGLTVRQKYIHIRGTLLAHSSNTSVARCRCSLVCKRNVQGTTAVYSDVYDQSGSYDWQGMRAFNGMRNYFVLRDQTFSLSNSTTSNLPRERQFDWYIPIDMRSRWEYGQTGGGVADLQAMGLFFLFYDSQASEFSTLQLTWRIGFYDN